MVPPPLGHRGDPGIGRGLRVARRCAHPLATLPRGRLLDLGAAAGLAQLVEHFSCKEDVIGSIPIPGSKQPWVARSAISSRPAANCSDPV